MAVRGLKTDFFQFSMTKNKGPRTVSYLIGGGGGSTSVKLFLFSISYMLNSKNSFQPIFIIGTCLKKKSFCGSLES